MIQLICLQRALLYSGVNQLACGRHSGEDRHRNALKMMQRAVLLCPGINIMSVVSSCVPRDAAAAADTNRKGFPPLPLKD